MSSTRLFTLTFLTMIAFAANTVLCRLALKDTAIDAASFTTIRLVSGALALWIIVYLRDGAARGNWPGALALFAYAAPFSFAYISLEAGVGALLLFGAVQATMIVTALARGERLGIGQSAGFVLALGGLAYLLFPGIAVIPANAGAQYSAPAPGFKHAGTGFAGETPGTGPSDTPFDSSSAPMAVIPADAGIQFGYFWAPAFAGETPFDPSSALRAGYVQDTPPLAGSLLMLTAGIAWGVYSLLGRGARDPLADTAGNFLRAAPLAIVLSAATLPWARFDVAGAGYAVLSGALASGMGYAIWYAALRGLTATRAAAVQLSVPVIAALGGVLFVNEPVTLRLVIASAAILGGIALVIAKR